MGGKCLDKVLPNEDVDNCAGNELEDPQLAAITNRTNMQLTEVRPGISIRSNVLLPEPCFTSPVLSLHTL